QFSTLVDQLDAYSSPQDPLYFTLRFIDGLRDDIKSVVLVQRPQDLDTACALASLQEEVGDSSCRRGFRRSDSSSSFKPQLRGALPLPAPPPRDRPSPAMTKDDRHSGD